MIIITDPTMAAHRAYLVKRLKDLRPLVDDMAREVVDHAPADGTPDSILAWIEERFSPEDLSRATLVAIIEASIAKLDDEHGTEITAANPAAMGWLS